MKTATVWLWMALAVPAWCQVLTFTTSTTLPPAMVGRNYSLVIQASGGTGTITYTLGSSSQIPNGMAFTNGILSGTPTSNIGSPFPIIVTATDSATPVANSVTQTFSLAVLPQLGITLGALPNGVAGVAYNQTVTASGGTPPYEFSGSGFPPNLSISSTGVISGTPASAGTTTGINVTVRESSTQQYQTSITYNLTITSSTGPTITTASPLPAATVSRPYSQQLAATGGTGSITWALAPTSASLPAGITLSAGGLISGTPSAAGTANVTIRATDGSSQFTDKAFALTVNPVPAITTSSLPTGQVSTAYSTTLAATGGTTPYTWAVTSGTLPAGLTLNAGTGAITGTPTASASPTLTFQVTDNNGATATIQLPLTITGPLTITTTSLSNATLNSAYSATLSATGGTGTLTWSITSGSLPTGLTQSNGVISGTPTATGQSTFTVQVMDSASNTATRQLTLTVVATGLVITTQTLPQGLVNTLYTTTLLASGGSGSGYTWALAAGSAALPAGLVLSTGGVLSGTPTAAANVTITVQVTDSASTVATKQFALAVVSNPLTITTTSPLPDATQNVAYTTTFQASGGAGTSYVFSVASGTLPTGLNLNANGTLSGTPTQASTYSFTIQAADGSGGTATKPFTIAVIAPSLTITTQTLPSGTTGQAYSATLAASGGTPPYTYSITVSSLPAGLTLNTSTGAITGTPTAAGGFNFTAQVRDANNQTSTRNLSIQIVTFTITSDSLPDAAVGVPYSFSLTTVGGTPPFSWSISSGAPPAGITLGTSTGVLSGTSNAAGTSQFTVRVQDASANVATRLLQLIVTTGLTITTQSLPNAAVGTGYQQMLQGTGGTPPYLWDVISGALPVGLTLNSGTGVISGTPNTTINSPFSFVIRLRDNAGAQTTKLFTIAVSGSSEGPAISTVSLPNATPGIAYSQALQATGGTPPYTWTVNGGGLPASFTLSVQGVLAGTATQQQIGSYPFSVQVTDAGGLSSTKQLILNVSSASSLTVNTLSLPNGSAGSFYNQTLTATGGSNSGFVWQLAAGSGPLPPGLTLNPSGQISGTPTTAGAFPFTVQVTDSLGATATRGLSITIGSLAILTDSIPQAGVAVAYSYQLQATGGQTPYTWSIITGALPQGLQLNPASGLISGTTSSAGTYPIVVQVRDNTTATAQKAFSLVVGTGGLTIATTAIPAATLNTAYSFILTSTGGVAPFTWSIPTGQLPAGLTLTPATGTISGTPTAPGSYTLVFQVVDGTSAVATKVLTILVTSPLSISTTSLPNGQTGTAYSQVLTATGGTGTGLIWLVTNNTLPPGLSLSQAGSITGVPTVNGTYTFTVQVSDSASGVASRQLTITIGASITISPDVLPNGSVGTAYNQTLTATGGTGALQWSTTGNLPPGVTLGPSTGLLAGTPTSAGSFSFTVRVQDASSSAATKNYTVVIGEGLVITTSATLPAASENVAYNQTLATSGGTAPFNWRLLAGNLPPGLTLNTNTGVISGTPTSAGSFGFIIEVRDSRQVTGQKAFTLQVGGRISIVTAAALPPATVRVAYRETLTASGGTAPYTWALAPGGLPPLGLTVGQDGVISGTPSNAGSFSFGVQVTDGAGATATRTFNLTVLQALSISTASPLPAATAGSAYAQALTAAGGQSPYTWSVASGALPGGLALTSAGIVSGTPTANGTFNFTVQVTDANRATASASYSLVVRLPSTPVITVSGLPETITPAQQPRLSIGVGAVYPVPINGTLTLTFTPDAANPADDPAVVFSSGGRTLNFTIPANATDAQLPAGFAMQTGTVAGEIRLALTLRANGQDITPTPAPVSVGRVAKAAPVVRAVSARRVTGGLEVVITGFSTTRDVSSATFRFAPAAGSSLQTTELTVQLAEGARAWYQSEASRQFGSQFTLTQQFNVQGDTSAIASVSVTLTNGEGTSTAVSANF